MKTVEQQITERLKTEIETSAKTKTQIADELGISKPTLSQYLSGRILPSLVTFARLCKILDCSADDILDIR
ncbi:MAG: helix-turn-helix transcriptional regulator [Eubacteriales bacterium]|nr:helix-turn-helix transcriptional regulator [Eubacteriales bacterium]